MQQENLSSHSLSRLNFNNLLPIMPGLIDANQIELIGDLVLFNFTFNSKQAAEVASQLLHNTSAHFNSITTKAQGQQLEVSVDKLLLRNFENDLIVRPIVERRKCLEEEAKTLTKSNWLVRRWYGLNTKLAKITALKDLEYRLSTDQSKDLAAHIKMVCEATPVINAGFFSQRTKQLLSRLSDNTNSITSYSKKSR